MNSLFESGMNDLRFGLRRIIHAPLFSAIVVISLTIGIGSNIAIFNMINVMLLRSLLVREPRQLVMLTSPSDPGWFSGLASNERSQISYQEFRDLQSHLTRLSGLCVVDSGLREWQVRVDGGQLEPVRGKLVSSEYFAVMGVDPVIGRVFDKESGTEPGKDPYVVISHRYWQRRFDGKRDVLGTSIKLNGTSFAVIGVGPRGFTGETVSESPDLWIPMMMQAAISGGKDWLHDDPAQSLRKIMWLNAFGRLKPDTSIVNLQSEVNVVFRQMMTSFYPPTLAPDLQRQAMSQYLVVRDAHSGAMPGRDNIASQLSILLIITVLVLLIACANVANLLLEKATGRQREVGVRLCVGATRGRLFRQFFTESFVLSAMGGVFGLMFGLAASSGLSRVMLDPQQALDVSVGLDWRVLAYSAVITLLTSVCFGVAPALRAGRTKLYTTVRGSVASNSASPGSRLNVAKVLVILQVALSLLVIVVSGLFLRTLWNLQSISLGYSKEQLLQVSVDGGAAGLKDQSLLQFYQNLSQRAAEIPGVRGVTYSRLGLLTGRESQARIEAEGFVARRDEDKRSGLDYIGPGYFAVLGIPLLIGRDISARDMDSSLKVCLINEELAHRVFEGPSPLGRHISVVNNKVVTTMEVVGVVRNVRSSSLRKSIPPMLYVPLSQAAVSLTGSISFEIRTAGDPKAIIGGVHRAIAALNPDAPITSSASMQDVIDDRTFEDRRIAFLCSMLGLVAVVLAAIGLYGVLSSGIARRRSEIGLRMALGAGRGSVVGMILRETSFIVTMGLVVGVVAAAISTRTIAARLYGLGQMDPLTIGSAILLLAMVALVAASIPAMNAAKVDPLEALRQD